MLDFGGNKTNRLRQPNARKNKRRNQRGYVLQCSQEAGRAIPNKLAEQGIHGGQNRLPPRYTGRPNFTPYF